MSDGAGSGGPSAEHPATTSAVAIAALCLTDRPMRALTSNPFFMIRAVYAPTLDGPTSRARVPLGIHLERGAIPLPQDQATTTDLETRIGAIIDRIRPAVQSDGGDIEFVEITPEGTVRIRFHGACVGCPSSLMTLKMGIERNLMDYVPEIQRVEAVD